MRLDHNMDIQFHPLIPDHLKFHVFSISSCARPPWHWIGQSIIEHVWMETVVIKQKLTWWPTNISRGSTSSWHDATRALDLGQSKITDHNLGVLIHTVIQQVLWLWTEWRSLEREACQQYLTKQHGTGRGKWRNQTAGGRAEEPPLTVLCRCRSLSGEKLEQLFRRILYLIYVDNVFQGCIVLLFFFFSCTRILSNFQNTKLSWQIYILGWETL